LATQFQNAAADLTTGNDTVWLASAVRTVGELIQTAHTRRRAHALFDTISHTDSATAWVAHNDTIALLALDYLQEHHVQLPQELSLIGFDDTLEGFGRGLSSYSFNVTAIVSAMFEHVLAPRRTGPRSRVVEIPGMVLERQTSGIADAK